MFDSTLVVQSAISAFNNAALAGPAFLWWAILAAPLFVMVWWCGDAFLKRIGWTCDVLGERVTLWTVVLTLAWVVLFGGNYAVLRDSMTLLPFLIAAIVFVSALFIGSRTHMVALPARRGRNIIALILVVLAVALSDTHAWWGPLLQVGAFILGLITGRAARGEMRPMAGTVLIILATTTAILMQPEFFRFGQLGALSVLHLAGLLSVGMSAAAAVALHNVRPMGRIGRGAYVKLKWIMRLTVVLGIILFGMTESVPVFFGAIVAMFCMCALSVWHARAMSADLGNKMFAVCLMSFGVITVMPAITALGLIFYMNQSRGNLWRVSRFLL